jgi:hypothetical protein
MRMTYLETAQATSKRKQAQAIEPLKEHHHDITTHFKYQSITKSSTK